MLCVRETINSLNSLNSLVAPREKAAGWGGGVGGSSVCFRDDRSVSWVVPGEGGGDNESLSTWFGEVIEYSFNVFTNVVIRCRNIYGDPVRPPGAERQFKFTGQNQVWQRTATTTNNLSVTSQLM